MTRILFVEDDDSTRFLVTRLLLRDGFDVVSASNGREGLETLLNDAAFDLVLTDIMVPEMDGIEFTRHVSARYLGVPIIAVSAFSSEADAALKVGAARFVAKPFRIPELIEAIIGVTSTN